MKIEKLNDNQIKFILNHDDLKNWDIKLAELTQGTERSVELFHDMMEQAFEQCNFRVDNTPLLIEAIPHSADGIIIIVTKVSDAQDVDERFGFPPISKLLERFRSKTADTSQRFPNTPSPQPQKAEPKSVFSFDSLDETSLACARLLDSFWGESMLYKNDGRYFLLLNHDENSSRIKQSDIEAVLAEYGRRETATPYSEYYLAEHGEVLIGRSAVGILARY